MQRGLADFVLALVLFWAIALGASSSDIRAHALPLTGIMQMTHTDRTTLSRAGLPAPDADGIAHARLGPPAAGRLDLALLSLAFAALCAGNLAFWRHLRRVYASPRRNVWRRG